MALRSILPLWRLNQLARTVNLADGEPGECLTCNGNLVWHEVLVLKMYWRTLQLILSRFSQVFLSGIFQMLGMRQPCP